MITKLRSLILLVLVFAAAFVKAQAPSITYNTPQTYSLGTPITALTPANTGGVVPLPIITSLNYIDYAGGLAVSKTGDIYVANASTSIIKIPAGGGAPVSVGSGLQRSIAVATDPAGDVFVSDYNVGIKKLVGNTFVSIGQSVAYPGPLKADDAGNVFFIDHGLYSGTTTTTQIDEIAAATGAVTVIASLPTSITDLALDANDNIYITDFYANQVKEITAGTHAVEIVSPTINNLNGITIDKAGNIFVFNNPAVDNPSIFQIPPGGGEPSVRYTFDFGGLSDLVVDNNNNFLAVTVNSIYQIAIPGGYSINPDLPAGLNFNINTGAITGTPTAASPAKNYTVTAFNASGTQSTQVNIAVVPSTMAPRIHYSSPQAYTVGTPITPLAPSNTGDPVPVPFSTALSSSINTAPIAIGVDEAGNVYVGEVLTGVIMELPASGDAAFTRVSGLGGNFTFSVDGAGDIYLLVINISENQEFLRKNTQAGTDTTLQTFSVYGPIVVTIATDYAGNLYTWTQQSGGKIQKYPGGTGSPIMVGYESNAPNQMYVDGAGNVYCYEGDVNLTKFPAGGGAPVSYVLANTSGAVAVDLKGNIYFVTQNSVLMEIQAGSKTPVPIMHGTTIYRMATDKLGYLYFISSFDASINKIPPPGYSISPTLPGGLILDATTGTISGVPTLVSMASHYTVTATNASGTSSAIFNLAVNLPPKPVISYESPNQYSIGKAIQPLMPATSGGASTTQQPSTLVSGLYQLSGLAINGSGEICTTSEGPIKGLIAISPTGAQTIAGGGYYPQVSGVAYDGLNNLYIVEAGTTEITESPIQPGPVFDIRSLASPYGIAADPAGNLYVTDDGDNTVKQITAGGGAVVTIASGFNSPRGVAVDAAGNIYVADQGNNQVKKITAGSGTATVIGYGFNQPAGVAVDAGGNVYVADYNNHAIKKIAPDGNVSTIYEADNTLPNGVALDKGGNIYFSEADNDSVIKIPGGFSISPALPAGLSFDAVTGTIAGTPTVGTIAKDYLVIASNAGGTDSAFVNIQTFKGDLNLGRLAISVGSLTPAFDSTKTSYQVTVSSSTNILNVTPTAVDPTSTVTVNGTDVTSGTASYNIPIPLGSKTIDIKVRSADKLALKNYTITVTRPVSTDAALSAIGPSNGVLLPPFDPNTTIYNTEVSNSVATMTVRPITADPTATMTVNGVTVKSATKCAPIPLSVGSNTVTIVVTAQDSVTSTTYTIAVTREATGGAALSNLVISDGTLSPVFDYTTTSYNTTVPNATSTITVTPTAADITAIITVNSTTVASGSASGPIALAEGDNTITIAVTSHGGRYNDTYTIDVYRVPGGADAYTSIGVNNLTEHPSFDDDVLVVHKGVSPNGDGIDDYLVIDGILAYPDNKLRIMNRNGQLIYEVTGYGNSSRVFDGHSNKNGQLQLPGTYFYELDYMVKGITKHKSGYLVLKY